MSQEHLRVYRDFVKTEAFQIVHDYHLVFIFDVYFGAILQSQLESCQREGTGRWQASVQGNEAFDAIELCGQHTQPGHQALASLFAPEI